MEQRNSEKNQKSLVLNDKCFFYLFTFNSRADIMTKYTFNQVRCFFMGKIPVKYMNDKFPVLACQYIYIYILYNIS